MRNSIIKTVGQLVLVVVTFVTIVALVGAIAAGYVNPHSYVSLQFLALCAPFIYIVLFVELVLWMILWNRRMMIICCSVLVICFWVLGDFVQLRWTKHYDTDKKNADELTLVSYNTHCMGNFYDSEERLTEICNGLDSLDADVICLQEFTVRDSVELDIVDKLFSKYAYRMYQYNPNKSLKGYSGRITLSKYPLDKRKDYSTGDYGAGFLSCNMVHQNDTLRIFNCHLQTTGVNKVNHEQGVMKILKGDSTKVQSREIMVAMSENFRERALQADTLRLEIDKYNDNVLVLGDFNATPMSYTYEKVKGSLSDAFKNGGDGFGSTFRLMGGVFRIDYIFYNSDKYSTVTYESPEWEFSDHKPVLVTLKKLNDE